MRWFDMEDRKKILLITSWVSVVGNVLLSLLKITIGILSGSLAVLSDGLDSASDVVTSIVLLIATPIISRPPSSKYAYGHEKAENVASTILSFVIFFMGCQMFIASANKLLHPEQAQMPAMIAIWATVASIVGKLLLSLYQFQQGKRAGSLMLKANAINMRNDVIISLGVLLGLACTFILKIPVLDPVVALLISMYIVWSAIGIFREANVVLMDGLSDTSVYDRIIEATESVAGAHNPHRIRSHQTGNRYNIVLDIEVDGALPLSEAHRIAQKVEDSIKDAVGNVYDIVVHVEPLGYTHNEEKYGVSKNNL
ncbi:MAG: cation diffusion facilitator family transporter [Dysgonamonadaceae bacterium]|jgi:cation diffusion facilitator family transporter|nr:cation diffusion facilitator family transporter [Dysgonamonadaceae bacterium]